MAYAVALYDIKRSKKREGREQASSSKAMAKRVKLVIPPLPLLKKFPGKKQLKKTAEKTLEKAPEKTPEKAPEKILKKAGKGRKKSFA